MDFYIMDILLRCPKPTLKNRIQFFLLILEIKQFFLQIACQLINKIYRSIGLMINTLVLMIDHKSINCLARY